MLGSGTAEALHSSKQEIVKQRVQANLWEFDRIILTLPRLRSFWFVRQNGVKPTWCVQSKSRSQEMTHREDPQIHQNPACLAAKPAQAKDVEATFARLSAPKTRKGPGASTKSGVNDGEIRQTDMRCP